tara:strand:+ start:2021 stop:2269 length:249 start_codon:yes stop_codon:yes gene_type:complete
VNEIGDKMQCNIGAKGKAARLKMGILALGFAVVLVALILVGLLSSPLWWFPVAGVTFGGAFAIFEARAGWCVIRAMGFKTPI